LNVVFWTTKRDVAGVAPLGNAFSTHESNHTSEAILDSGTVGLRKSLASVNYSHYGQQARAK
jgi:hypothetical protein